jgi:Protein of unknown function DUF262/Protein of unknown function (DUF1524)
MDQRFKRIRIAPEQIGNALRTKFLRVPPNQREYSWKQKHVSALLDDFNNIIVAKGAEYFLGTIVVSNQDENSNPRVVDGQQRLATTLIFISAVRDYLDSQKDDEARKVESIYMLSPVLGEGDMAHLSLNDRDRQYFHDRVLLASKDPKRIALEKSKPTRPSHILINDAAKTARAYVQALVKGLSSETAKALLMEWLTFIEKKAIVIWVEVPDDRAAYTIFETMNDRGLDLSAIDLIKNHLFYMAEDEVGEAEREWSELIGVLESTQETDVVKDFVRHFWISRNGSTRTQELFDEIKDRAPNKTNAMALLQQFRSSADLYVALLNPMHGFWVGYTDRTRRNLLTVISLGVKQIRPLLLSVLERFPKREVELVVRLAVSWSVRLLATGEQGTGLVESSYGRSALAISKGEIKDAQELALELTSTIPADDAFESAFATMQASKASLARYYLRVLEQEANGVAEPENVPNDDPFSINLEHILPENPTSNEWDVFDAEQRALFTDRLGNLALLQRSPNSDLQSKSFAEKKTIYRQSGYILTREIADLPEWTPAAATDRQKRLAELAVKAWPITI